MRANSLSYFDKNAKETEWSRKYLPHLPFIFRYDLCRKKLPFTIERKPFIS